VTSLRACQRDGDSPGTSSHRKVGQKGTVSDMGRAEMERCLSWEATAGEEG